FPRDLLGGVGSDQYPTTRYCWLGVCGEQAATRVILRIGGRTDDHYRITAGRVEIHLDSNRDQGLRDRRRAAAPCYLAHLPRQLDTELAQAAGFESRAGRDGSENERRRKRQKTV